MASSPPKVQLQRVLSKSSDCLLDIDSEGSNHLKMSQNMNPSDDSQLKKRPDLLRVETNLTRRVMSEGDLLSPTKTTFESSDDRTVSYGENKLLSAVVDKPKMRRVTDSHLLGGRRPEDVFGAQAGGHHTGGITSWLFGSSSGASSTTNTTTTQPIPQLVPMTIQPEPRRLFGFGPTFQPPSETVMVPAGDGSLLKKIKQEGLENAVKAPTQAEINTFGPFSM